MVRHSGRSKGRSLRSRVRCQRQGETAWEDGSWRQLPIFEGLTTLKVEAQERCRGETNPVGQGGGLDGLATVCWPARERRRNVEWALARLGIPAVTDLLVLMR